MASIAGWSSRSLATSASVTAWERRPVIGTVMATGESSSAEGGGAAFGAAPTSGIRNPESGIRNPESAGPDWCWSGASTVLALCLSGAGRELAGSRMCGFWCFENVETWISA